MKQLTCEMCGSTDLIKQDGMFVCQTCGTKYSVEEARKMMIEGAVDVSGSTVKVDKTENVQNYLMMAKQAYDSGNKAEAEAYCNKIIENSPDNYEAWLLKGKAAGWQSTVANLRFDQAINCFSKSLENAPEDKVEELKKEISSETSSLSLALVSLCCDHYESLPDNDHAAKIISSLTTMNKLSLNLLTKCGVEPDSIKKQAATRIYNAVYNAWYHTINTDYREDSHPSKYKWERYVSRGDAALVLLDTVLMTRGEDDKTNTDVYRLMINIQTALIGSASYKYSVDGGGYVREYMLNTSSVSSRRTKIKDYHTKWSKLDSTHVIPTEDTLKKATVSAQESNEQANMAACICMMIIIAIVAVMSFS